MPKKLYQTPVAAKRQAKRAKIESEHRVQRAQAIENVARLAEFIHQKQNASFLEKAADLVGL